MSKSFEFNAPQFIDFAHLDDPQADKFFDPCAPLKSPEVSVKGSKNSPILRKVLNELVNHQIQLDIENVQPSNTADENQKDLIQGLENLQLSDFKNKERKPRAPLRATQRFDGLLIEPHEPKPHKMTTRLDSVLKTPILKLRSRSVPKQINSGDESQCQAKVVLHEKVSNTTADVKVGGAKRNASPLHSTKKFISLAEKIQHFHKDTPDRFRSKPKTVFKPSCLPKLSCNPKTPNLIARTRHRPVNFPDEKQREEMELQEMKKHQVKAHPLNEKILRGPSLGTKVVIKKKPSTIPEPFSLTEIKKKEPPTEEIFQFKAHPVPANILQRTIGIPMKRVFEPTVPHTPQIKVPLRYRCPVKTPDQISSDENLNLPRNTKVEPFSFDEKMRENLQKKEENIKKIIEEEKKTFSSFKAHPMPSFNAKLCQTLKLKRTPVTTELHPFKLTQPRSAQKKLFCEENELKSTPFKARPATVIHKKPFEPKLNKSDVPMPEELHLNTEKRAMERKKFEEKMKQKEETLALLLKQQKEEEEEKERLQKMKERKLCEFKANPVPRYKPFEIRASEPSKLTMPVSPVFLSGKSSKMNKNDRE